MSHLVTLAVGITIGAGAMYRRHVRWAEAHHYRRIRLEATRVRELADQADHDHRAAARYKSALEALRAIHQDIVGDLLDRVARHDQPRHMRARRTAVPQRRSAMPPYGAGRQTVGAP